MWSFIVSLSQLQQLEILKWCELFKWRLELNLRACTVKTHTRAVNMFAYTYETQVSHTRNKCRVAYGHAGWLTSAKRVRWSSLILSIAALQSRLTADRRVYLPTVTNRTFFQVSRQNKQLAGEGLSHDLIWKIELRLWSVLSLFIKRINFPSSTFAPKYH